jgi:HlyD family secretion protein
MTTTSQQRKRLITLGIGLLIVALAAGLVWFLVKPKEKPLTLSGLVQAKEVKIASRLGGRVQQILVDEGDAVQPGQLLLSLDEVDLRAQIAEAQSALNIANARLSLLRQGADPEDIRQASSQVQQAQQQLRQVRSGVRPEELAQANSQLNDATSRFNAAKEAYDNASELLQSGVISQQKYNMIQADYISAQSAHQTAQSKVSMLRKGARPEEVRIAQAQVSGAQAQLQKLAKGSKPQDLRIAQANVDEAQSALKALQARLGDLNIKAPIAGTVSILNASPGEIVPPNRAIVAIINYQNLWADVYVPESKLQWIQLGQPIEITSPVFPKATFQGKVTFINPRSEFIPQGASAKDSAGEEASFRVKVTLPARDVSGQHQLLPGMTIYLSFQPSQS